MKDKKMPTILGTFLLLTILFSGVWLSMQKTNTFSNASGDCGPSSVQVTNLTNKSADISFLTTALCTSAVNINNITIANFKDKSTTHYFRIDGLSSSTQYQYYFIIDGINHQQAEYNFKTAPLPSGNLSTANLAWGKIITSSNKGSPETIVYLNISGAWPLSALTDSDGQWHIPLSNSFTEDKNSLFVPPTSGTEDIFVYSSDSQLTQVENSVSNNDPVPNIIIGQGFGSGLGTDLKPTIILPTLPAPTSFSVGIGGLLAINSPAEGESITALKPDIFGSGKNNSIVNLSIDTDIIGKTTTKSDGTWHWSPDSNLKLGKHLLTVTLGNELLQRNFTVVLAKNSTSPLSFSATPSATIVPIATIVPTIAPTAIPTIRTQKPSTKSSMPVTGNSFPFYFLILSSLFTVSFSLYFFYRDEK